MPTLTPMDRAKKHYRRFRFWVTQFRWWAILALVAAISGVVIAFTDRGLAQVVAVGVLSITLAILARGEEPR